MFDVQAHKELEQKCKEAEFFETDPWAAEGILDVEILTSRVLDPCAGRGVLGQALRKAGYDPELIAEYDLNQWPGQPSCIQPGINYLSDQCAAPDGWSEDGFSVMMNPPFSKAVEFVQKSLELGARKVLMFQRMAFLESAGRREFWSELAPTRVWVCGSRATCWRGDIPDEDIVVDEDTTIRGKKGRSASTPHAWFVWERGHRGAMTTSTIYKD